MRKLSPVFKIIIILIFAFATVIFIFLKKKPTISFTQKRIYQKPLLLEKLIPINVSIGKLNANNNGELTVLDNYTQKVLILDSKFNVAHTLGGNGDGPGKNRLISSLESDSSRIYTSDMLLHTFTVKNYDDSVLEHYHSKLNFRYNIKAEKSNYILSFADRSKSSSQLSFGKLNLSNFHFEQFPKVANLFPASKFSDMTYAGFFAKNSKQIFYVCYFTNNIISFDSQGNVLFSKRAIYNPPIPEVYKEGNSVFVGKSVIVTYSVAADDNYLYILSKVTENDSKLKTLDVYNCKNGNYIRSYKIPIIHDTNPTEVYVFHGKIYLSYKRYLAIFKNQI